MYERARVSRRLVRSVRHLRRTQSCARLPPCLLSTTHTSPLCGRCYYTCHSIRAAPRRAELIYPAVPVPCRAYQPAKRAVWCRACRTERAVSSVPCCAGAVPERTCTDRAKRGVPCRVSCWRAVLSVPCRAVSCHAMPCRACRAERVQCRARAVPSRCMPCPSVPYTECAMPSVLC